MIQVAKNYVTYKVSNSLSFSTNYNTEIEKMLTYASIALLNSRTLQVIIIHICVCIIVYTSVLTMLSKFHRGLFLTFQMCLVTEVNQIGERGEN